VAADGSRTHLRIKLSKSTISRVKAPRFASIAYLQPLLQQRHQLTLRLSIAFQISFGSDETLMAE
jgi:hypothetical protein